MKASVKQYAQALFDLSQGKDEKEIAKVIKDFAKLLVEHNQVAKLDRIVSHFSLLWNRENSIVEAEIVSASELDKKVVRLLEEYVKEVSQAKDVNISSTEDKNILGGVVIKYGDNIFDASLRTRLNELKKDIKN